MGMVLSQSLFLSPITVVSSERALVPPAVRHRASPGGFTAFTLHLLCQKGGAGWSPEQPHLLCHHRPCHCWLHHHHPPSAVRSTLQVHRWTELSGVLGYCAEVLFFLITDVRLVVHGRGEKKGMASAAVMLPSLRRNPPTILYLNYVP